MVLCEGTRHCAVGSIVGVNNAKVAGMIGVDMMPVANDGLDKSWSPVFYSHIHILSFIHSFLLLLIHLLQKS